MVSRVQIIELTENKMFLDILPSKTRRAFLVLSKSKLFKGSGWYLAGGSALALQVGHRQSVDLDFFTVKKDFSVSGLERALMKTGKWDTTARDKGTLYGTFLGAKVSFIAYPFFVPSKNMARHGTIRILLPDDIAAMKIVAISQRGRKRDFIDLYWYCQNHESLEAVISRAIKQYPFHNHNVAHFLTSLVYFEDAEKDPMPRAFFKVTWKEIKKFFRKETPRITREFLGLK